MVWFMVRLLPVFMAVSSLATVPSSASAEYRKTKIAVLDFQHQGGGRNDFDDIGKIVAEWLITDLVKDGRFDVIERRLLEKVLAEQRIGTSGIVDASSASRLGKVLGARVVITGSVLEFQNVVEVNARIIEVESSSILAAESAKSTSTATLEELVANMTGKIIRDFPLEGYIVQRDRQSVLIDLGQHAGVRRGMQFMVYREGKVIKHPKTGEVLEIETIEAGVIEVTDVSRKTAAGVIVKESAPDAVAYGLMVRSLLPGQALVREPERPKEPVREPERKKARVVPDEPSGRKVHIPSPTF